MNSTSLACILLIETYKIITGKELLQSERSFELAPNKATSGLKYKLFKKSKEHQGRSLQCKGCALVEWFVSGMHNPDPALEGVISGPRSRLKNTRNFS